MEELKSNPRRQAIHALKGYSYQIWQSLLCWVSLAEGEKLFLEGAEDIDFHGPSGIEAIQVKEIAASGSLTLRSPDVLEAIANFWQHQQQNPGETITFRFLTTAERGSERPNPFGNLSGLDLWDRCKYPGSDLQALRCFLSGQQSLSAELRDFSNTATDEQLRQRLLIPIGWDTGNKSQPFIEDMVERKVSTYGDRVFNLQHSESIKVVPCLLQHVFDTAKRKGTRCLEATDFWRIFEEAITERITKPELQRLRQADAAYAQLRIQPEAFGLAGTGELRLTRFAESVLEVLRPLHNERLVGRKQLAAELLGILNTDGLLVLSGSTGMGKSTLANVIAMSGLGNWRWLDMRGVEPGQVKERLLYAAHLIEDSREQIDCIVDDLNFDNRPDVYENALARLIYAVRLNSGRFIITTQGVLPSRVVSLCDIAATSSFDVPLLSEQEITELVSSHGCPLGRRLDGWSHIVHSSTKGHPLLAHARVRSQEAQGWSVPTYDDLLASPGIDEIRREIRQRLRDELSSDEARMLLYRLSIFTRRFERQQALHLGKLEPQIRIPGEAFDSLVGPWVEQIDDQHFRLSPLLENTAKEVFSEPQLVELHRVAAESVLALGTIGFFTFDALLTHGFMGRDGKSLATAAMSVLSHSDEVPWPELSNFVSWFSMIRLEVGEKLYDDDSLLNTLLRRLQFRIAMEINPNFAVKVAGVWEQEVRHLVKEQLPASASRTSLILFLMEVTSADRVPFRIPIIISYLCETLRTLKQLKHFTPKAADRHELLDTDYQLLANPRTLLFQAMKWCKGAADVVELLSAINNLASEEAHELWQLLSDSDFEAMLLIDSGWLAESRSESPDWPAYLESLVHALAIAPQRKPISLIAAIYRAKAIVLKEYCDDRAGALESLEEGERAIGQQHCFLREYRAKIFFLEESYDQALTIWRSILPDLEREQNEGRIYAYRDAATCAAKIGNWLEAADLFYRGAEASQLPLIKLPHVPEYQPDHSLEFGFKAEYALALWKGGRRADAVRECITIFELFKEIPNPEKNKYLFQLYRNLGHTTAWFNMELSGTQTLTEPVLGWFTQRDEKVDDIVRELSAAPIPQINHVRFVLASLEYKLNLGDALFRRFESDMAKSVNLPELVLGYHHLQRGHSLKALRIENLVGEYLTSLSETKTYILECVQQHKFNWSEVAELKQLLFAALLRFFSDYRNLTMPPITRWRQDINQSEQLREGLGKWLDLVQAQLENSPYELKRVLRNGAANGDERLLAAILLSASDDLDPESLFYANVLLAGGEYNSLWQEAYEDGLATMLSSKWEKVIREQPFSLRSPQIHCPLILSACNDTSSTGFQKIAKILLSVNAAVQTRIGDPMLNLLRQRAE